ncbi:MAG: glycosyltransferase family 2 protein [Bacteroidota bacterium]|nr:glycosyltransferase family 2 protein [Bacteroidota bacterium]
MKQKLAVVILNYNGKHFLEKFLSNIINFSSPHEVIVADNASTDDSISFLKNNFSKVKLIQNSTNVGYAGGYNEALKQIDSEYYVLLNNDVQVKPNWLQPLVELMDSDTKIAACQPKLLDQKNKNIFEYAGASGGFMDAYGYPFCRGRIFESIEEDKGQYEDIKEIFWASGACLMVRSNIFWQVGGFDTDYFAHMEEIDLCWRMQNFGYKVYVEPNSYVYHVGGGTLQKQNAHKTFLNFRNSLITLTKDHPSKGLLFKLWVRLNLDGIAGAKFFFSLQPQHCFAILRAHFAFYFSIGKTLKKRKQLKALNGYEPQFDNSYNKSIVYAYFIKGKKKFNELD